MLRIFYKYSGTDLQFQHLEGRDRMIRSSRPTLYEHRKKEKKEVQTKWYRNADFNTSPSTSPHHWWLILSLPTWQDLVSPKRQAPRHICEGLQDHVNQTRKTHPQCGQHHCILIGKKKESWAATSKLTLCLHRGCHGTSCPMPAVAFPAVCNFLWTVNLPSLPLSFPPF